MRAVLQRVDRARVRVEDEVVGQIGHGVLALVAATHADTAAEAEAMARKIVELRILSDDTSLSDHVGGPAHDPHRTGSEQQATPGASQATRAPAVLLVSQFTLYGTTKKGRRPSWSAAAPGPAAEPLVDAVADEMRRRGVEVATGVFGAQMEVELVNSGPFTLIVDT
ncbi:MAG: D-aminoacyl-tRNA deacylase [Ornithinimicrobium sp.]